MIMEFNLKKYLRYCFLTLLNNIIFFGIILFDYNISLAICKFLNINKNFKLFIRSFGIGYDITIILVLLEITIGIFIINNIKNNKNKVICITN